MDYASGSFHFSTSTYYMTTTTDLQAAIAGYASALALDALNPRPDYNIDGQQVSRSVWRDSLIKAMKDMSALSTALNPYFISTVNVI